MEIDISNKRLEGVFDIEQHCKANGIDVEEVKELYCEYNKLTKLKGLDKLVNLKWLYCEYNKLTELDVSKLVNLESLGYSMNQLTELKGLDKLVNLVTLNGEGYKQPDKRDLILNKIDSLFKRIENVEQNIAEIKRQIRQ